MKGVKSFTEIEIKYSNELDKNKQFALPKIDSSLYIYEQNGLLSKVYNYCDSSRYLQKYFFNSNRKIIKSESWTSQDSLIHTYDYIYNSYNQLTKEIINSYRFGKIKFKTIFYNLYNSKGERYYSETRDEKDKIISRHQLMYDLKGNNVMDIWLSKDSLQIKEIWLSKFDTLNRELEVIYYTLEDGGWSHSVYKYNKMNDWIEDHYRDSKGVTIELLENKIKYDKHGNWIQYSSYRNKKLIDKRTRRITYY
jgi:hypothetical protein